MMEIMVVVFILAMFLGLAATRFNMGSEKDVNNQVKDLALLGRHLRAQARIHNRTYRLTFDLPTEQEPANTYRYAVEYSSQRVFLPGPDDEIPLGGPLEAGPVESSFAPDDKVGENGTRSLTSGLRVTQVELSTFPDPIQHGPASIHFFPNGRVEEAVVHLEWGSDAVGESLSRWSVYFRPYTGDPEVLSGHIPLVDLGVRN